MNAFISTRGAGPVTLAEAVFRGLAPDGGLYVPARLPGLSSHSPFASVADDIRPLAHRLAPELFPTVAAEALARVVEQALDFPIPLVEVEPGRFVLELFHGPTHAFKDVGARFMAALMVELDAGSDVRRTVLVATSGDTGGAVASAYHGREGYTVIVLFPHDRISERQRRQMTTLGDNVHALSVTGTFDDCQRMVKAAFSDRTLADRHHLTSANSINVARLLPQALYYIHAASLLNGRSTSGGSGELPAPRFVVPTGNLGNLCAGLLASRVGMPNARFVAAGNANRSFVDFLDGAPFEARPAVMTTSSAMDVGMPSNLERLRWIYDGDDDALRRAVLGVTVTDEQAALRIGETWRRAGYMLDPHTAVAYDAAARQGAGEAEPAVVLATAHPAKFPDVVEAVIGRAVQLPRGLRGSQERTERMRRIDATPQALYAALQEIGA